MFTDGRATDLHMQLLENVCLKHARSANRGAALGEEASHQERADFFGQLPWRAATLVLVVPHASFLRVEVAVHTAHHAFSGWLAHQVADFLRDLLEAQLLASWKSLVAQNNDLPLVVEVQPARMHHLAHHWHGVKRPAECQRRVVNRNSYSSASIHIRAKYLHNIMISETRSCTSKTANRASRYTTCGF